jgi:hypothetical protein
MSRECFFCIGVTRAFTNAREVSPPVLRMQGPEVGQCSTFRWREAQAPQQVSYSPPANQEPGLDANLSRSACVINHQFGDLVIW